MRNYFGYIRVSTARQGERGVSLQEQRDAIDRYANTNGLNIGEWFEECVTAAKSGRPMFSRMLDQLRLGKADGVVIHKIDRSARNLRDWAGLGELLDAGMDVRFAHESLDLQSRGGRLSADIQAVVAADFIRNLKQETRKGIYGRLKQGLLPLPAPLGYLDNGSGRPKTICPVAGPLIRRAFESYATGHYSLHKLSEEMFALGLRSRFGAKVSRSAWARLLRNPFYIGQIRIMTINESFRGVHKPLLAVATYYQVQDVLEGRKPKQSRVHHFAFRQIFNCQGCGNLLIGERQKGHVYYRCHTRHCRLSCLREDCLEAAIREALLPLKLSTEELQILGDSAENAKRNTATANRDLLESLRLQGSATRNRFDRLTDAYIDRLLTKETFESRREALVREQFSIDEKLRQLKDGVDVVSAIVEEILELAKSVISAYEMGKVPERRDILQNVFSNRTVAGKNVEFTMRNPYRAMVNRPTVPEGCPSRSTTRTWDDWLTEVARLWKIEKEERKQREVEGYGKYSRRGKGGKRR